DKRMTSSLVCRALMKAYNLRNPPQGLVVHTDRGAQYTSERFQTLLGSYGLRKSACHPAQASGMIKSVAKVSQVIVRQAGQFHDGMAIHTAGQHLLRHFQLTFQFTFQLTFFTAFHPALEPPFLTESLCHGHNIFPLLR
ncbi:transposase, partial [Salmonella enterica subsp. enterica]|nr:transposase [Salmonella enterica subsp. enterica]